MTFELGHYVFSCSLDFEKRLRETNRHAEVGTSETFDHRECHSNHFSVPVDQRPS